jgi:hypothetical protein
VGWPAVLVATDVMRPGPGLLAATGLAVVNTGVGVLVHQAGLRAVRTLAHRDGRPGPVGT